jgi:hypothetical protein
MMLGGLFFAKAAGATYHRTVMAAECESTFALWRDPG